MIACIVGTMPLHSKLYHRAPAWVPDTAVFHVRVRAERGEDLLRADRANGLVESACRYAAEGRWSCYIFLLMPDHLHAMLSFSRSRSMSEEVRNWKRGQSRCLGVRWQEGYFDHRIRSSDEFAKTYAYIERNPVVLNLCVKAEDWPWRAAAWSQEARPTP